MTWANKMADASLPEGPKHQPSIVESDGKSISEDTPRNRSAPDLGLNKCGSAVFELGDLYRVKKLMGQGAFGCVVAGEDARTGGMVAIKKVKSCTKDRTGAKRLLRELRFLRELRGHSNVIKLQDVFVRGSNGQLDTYIVTDLMEADLEQIIKSSQPLSTEHVRCLTFQMLNGLRHMHRNGIVHRDLKPANLVVDSQCRLKICDLGLSRHISENTTVTEAEDARFTDYVVTRWYRAPELLMGARRYTNKVDTWAAGCILGELIGRRPLFAGSDTSDMLVKLCTKLSPPTPRQLETLTQDLAAKVFVTAIPRQAEYSWSAAFPQAHASALSLMSSLLEWLPCTRLDVEESLNHPFMAALNDVSVALPRESREDEMALVSQRGLPIETVTDLILLEASHARSSDQHSLLQAHNSALMVHSSAHVPKCSCGQEFSSPVQLLSHLDPAFEATLEQQRKVKKRQQQHQQPEPLCCDKAARASNSQHVTMIDTFILL